MNWLNIEIDHVEPICMFDVSKDEELKEGFSWKIARLLIKLDHQQKGIKLNVLNYQLQYFIAYHFSEINEEE